GRSSAHSWRESRKHSPTPGSRHLRRPVTPLRRPNTSAPRRQVRRAGWTGGYTGEFLSGRRRRADVSPDRRAFLRAGGQGRGLAPAVPGRGSGPRRGAPAAVPHAVLGRAAHLFRDTRTPAAADATRPVPDPAD